MQCKTGLTEYSQFHGSVEGLYPDKMIPNTQRKMVLVYGFKLIYNHIVEWTSIFTAFLFTLFWFPFSTTQTHTY